MSDSVVVGAAFAQRFGYGGHAWALMQYVLGLQALGIEVIVVDRLEHGMVAPQDRGAALTYVDELMTRFSPGTGYAVLDEQGESLAGLSRVDLLRRVNGSRVLINVMGFVRDVEILDASVTRVFLDIDPGFPQSWHELDLADVFAQHDAFITVGRNVGTAVCTIPTCGKAWHTMPHPVALDRCPLSAIGKDFTSVGSWRGPYGPIEYGGQTFGLRVHQFRRFFELPRTSGASFRLALDIDEAEEADLRALRTNGWVLVDPRDVAHDPDSYRRFVAGSLAEFTVAKDMYVATRSGWLGDRTACYLASGKPALVQDTGLGSHYPLGEGLLAFSTPDDAVAGVEEILRDPVGHGRAARRLAEREFDATVLLGRLLEEVA